MTFLPQHFNFPPSSWLSSASSSNNNSNPGSPASLNTSANLRRDHYSGYDSPITDTNQLSEYLSDYSAWESSYLSPDKLDDSGSVASQSMLTRRGGAGGGGTRALEAAPAQFRKTVYQLSSPPAKTASSSSDSPTDKAQTEILSQQLGVDPMQGHGNPIHELHYSL